MSRMRFAGTIFIALTLAGCAGGPSLTSEPAPANADLGMAGRWILAAPGAPSCGMNFSGVAGKNDGSVAPEGGCPERLFMSRRWALENGALSIFDDEKTALAKMTFADGRFDGKSSAGTPLTLSR